MSPICNIIVMIRTRLGVIEYLLLNRRVLTILGIRHGMTEGKVRCGAEEERRLIPSRERWRGSGMVSDSALQTESLRARRIAGIMARREPACVGLEGLTVNATYSTLSNPCLTVDRGKSFGSEYGSH